MGGAAGRALANPLMHGTPQQITAEITLVDGLLTPAGQRAAFLRRRVLVDPRELPTPHGAPAHRPGSRRARTASDRRMLYAAVRPRARLQPPPERGSDR